MTAIPLGAGDGTKACAGCRRPFSWHLWRRSCIGCGADLCAKCRDAASSCPAHSTVSSAMTPEKVRVRAWGPLLSPLPPCRRRPGSDGPPSSFVAGLTCATSVFGIWYLVFCPPHNCACPRHMHTRTHTHMHAGGCLGHDASFPPVGARDAPERPTGRDPLAYGAAHVARCASLHASAE